MDQKPGETSPYNKLFIYFFDGRLKPVSRHFGSSFIGNWEEGDTSFLFFSEPADDRIDQLLAIQSHLTLKDQFTMTYDQWHGEPVNPFRVGKLLIMPPWKKVEADINDVPIILDPGVVFGAGSHPTTKDCLEAIEIICQNNQIESALDLGTGTGLLAIAAARLGCRKILAVDNNYLAAKTTRNNVILNNLGDRVCAIYGCAEALLDCPAELLIANIHYDIMKKLIVSPGFLQKKWIVLSGLLRSEAKHIEEQLAQYHVTVIKRWLKEGIWHTIYARTDA
jgi:ribosomal protein L11 methyltransferase